jgi:hypothetical protein
MAQSGRRTICDILAAGIPGARFVTLEGHNHLILESDPCWTRFLDEINDPKRTFGRASHAQLKCSDDIRRGPFLTRLREVIDLPSSGGKRILDRYLNMFVPCILRRRAVDENVFVRRNCKPDMDLERATVTVLVTRCDHSYAASDDAMIVFLQLGYLTID